LVTPRTNESATLLLAVKAELEAVRCFVDLLAIEQTALSNGNTEELPELPEQKNQFAGQLSKLAEQRNTSLSALGFVSDRAGIEAWCTKHPKETSVANAWGKIIALASEARELNRINGELIALRMQYNTKALEALRGGNDSLDLYGPDGQSSPLSNRRINDAV